MCGLFGMFNYSAKPLSKDQLEEFKELAVLNSERGPVSAGFLEVSDFAQQSYLYGHQFWLDHVKRDVGNLILEPHALLGHCRAPTSGSNSWVQPFRTKGKHGNSYIGHNGLILDVPKLRLMSGIEDTSLIDTHYLHQVFVNQSDAAESVDITPFLSTFDIPGSFTFWWFYAGKLVLARNQGTLYARFDDNGVTYSSVPFQDGSCLDDGDFLIIDDLIHVSAKFECNNPLM